MSKAKMAEPPQPKNRTKTGQRQRNDKGQFVPGNKNGGRPKLREEFKQFAVEKSIEALQVVYGIMTDVTTNQRDRTAAARLLMEYGYGRPAAEYDRERLGVDMERMELEKRKYADEREQHQEAGKASTIRVVFENDGLTTDELAELAK